MTNEFPQPIDITIDAAITKDDTSGGACVRMPGSSEQFGTGKSIKVTGTIDGHDLQATLLPTGGGTHMLPVKAALRKAIDKDVGDNVTIHLSQRLK